MLVEYMKAAFGPDQSFRYDPIWSDSVEIRRIIRKLSDGELSPDQALAEARNAKQPSLVADDERPWREGEEGDLPFLLVLCSVWKRNLIEAQEAYESWRFNATGAIEAKHLPEPLHDAYLRILHAIRTGAVQSRLLAPAGCPVAENPLFTDVRIDSEGRAYFWHADPERTSEVEKVEIRIVRMDFTTLWPAKSVEQEDRSRPAGPSNPTIRAQTIARRKLIELMTSEPNKPMTKAELRQLVEFKNVSVKFLNRIFPGVAEETRAKAWTRGGRRPKHAPSSAPELSDQPSSPSPTGIAAP